jgi:hypothetical protein
MEGGAMARVRLIGPIDFDLGPAAVPGGSTPTVWTTDPPFTQLGTVTFTAVPLEFDISVEDGARLATREPTVQKQAPNSIALHVIVANVGLSRVSRAGMFISFVEQ